MEKFIRDATVQFLQFNNYLTYEWFGFSTSAAWMDGNSREGWSDLVDFVNFDFQKAFDNVPHRRLIELIKYYQLDDSVVAWVSDFLRAEGNRFS